jgi:hypothetical protein
MSCTVSMRASRASEPSSSPSPPPLPSCISMRAPTIMMDNGVRSSWLTGWRKEGMGAREHAQCADVDNK